MNPMDRRLLPFLAAVLAVGLAAGWSSYRAVGGSMAASRQLEGHQGVLIRLRSLLLDISEAKEGQRSSALTGRKSSRNAYQGSLLSIDEKVKDLRKLPQWDARQQAALERMDFLLSKELDSTRQAAPARAKKGRPGPASADPKAHGPQALEKVRWVAAGLENEESGRVDRMGGEMEKRSALALRAFWTSLLVDWAILIGLSLFLVRATRRQARTEKDLRTLGETVDSLERNNLEISNLDNLVKSLQACLSVEEVAKTSVLMTQALFNNISGGILMINNSKTQLESIGAFGKESACKAVFEIDECWAMRRSQVHLVNREQKTMLCQHFKDGHVPQEYICVPLAAQGKLVGMFHLSSAQEGKLRDRQEKLASLMGEQIALALANLKLREELKNQSIRDAQTGMFNRRYLEESLEKAVAVADRKKGNLSVLMIDIDHFKEFNDKFGHEAGDRVLSEIGSLLNRSVRKGDVACRFGGEEMVLFFPETGNGESKKMAEKIRESVQQLNVNYLNVPLGKITVSVGVAVYPEDSRTAPELLRQADIALYNAKSLGRNRVVLWQDISMERRAGVLNPPKDPTEEAVPFHVHN